ncbi:MAG TPA: NRDE family protein [Vicinamibacterales bacterium]|nr:NRDE family protein [Vicinamibacterales bacterium]
MCTVSILPLGDGFRVMSNRDERRDRAVALAPRVETFGTRSVIMPIDPVGGGSWIGVNDAGLAAALLNRHRGPRPITGSCSSRGAIVGRALSFDSLAAAVTSVRELDATRFQPFSLVLVQQREIVLIASDSREVGHAASTLERPHMFTASSLGDFFVAAPRRRLFDCLMDHGGDRLRGQSLFHRHQWTDKRAISVLMERDDAATVSRTTVDVDQRGVALEYESLIPCRPAQKIELQSC